MTETRSHRLVVYLTPADFAKLKRRAERENRAMSGSAARLIVKELKRLEK